MASRRPPAGGGRRRVWWVERFRTVERRQRDLEGVACERGLSMQTENPRLNIAKVVGLHEHRVVEERLQQRSRSVTVAVSKVRHGIVEIGRELLRVLLTRHEPLLNPLRASSASDAASCSSRSSTRCSPGSRSLYWVRSHSSVRPSSA